MPRLNVVDPASASGKAREIFEGPLKGKHFNIFKGLANSGAGFNFYVAASGALADAALTPAEREVIALAVAEANSCEYCAAAHTAIGKMSGLSDAQTVEARK
ncbi:MAG: carboxymuconolactone decarboxylase family protein, partial [Phycisphaerales bacterium]|nr:carboxymuconolactone decarboxylase family protein [Phycisphaerales bacterium]